MNDKILNKYPLLIHNTEIRLYGRIGAIFYPGIDSKQNILPINEEACSVLKNINGNMKLFDLLNMIIERKPTDQEVQNLMIFFEKLHKIGIVRFFNSPQNGKLNIKGQPGKTIPMGISLELTNKCNYHCKYCYQNSNNRKHSFLKNPINILKYFKNKGTFTIELTGGEPLLHPDFKSIIKYIINNFSLLGIITNGSLLNSEIMKILSSSKKCDIVIETTLDGPSNEIVEDTTRTKGSFQQEINAIKLIKDYGFLLRVGMVVDHPNKIDMIEETLLLAKNLGADSFVANPVINFGRGEKMANLFSIEDNKRLNNKILEMYNKYKGYFSSETESGMFLEENFFNCGGGFKTLTISYNGIIKHCPMISDKDLSIAYWDEILTDKAQSVMRSYYELGAPNTKICEGCEYFIYCYHCVTRAFLMIEKKGKKNCTWYNKYKKQIDTIFNLSRRCFFNAKSFKS